MCTLGYTSSMVGTMLAYNLENNYGNLHSMAKGYRSMQDRASYSLAHVAKRNGVERTQLGR